VQCGAKIAVFWGIFALSGHIFSTTEKKNHKKLTHEPISRD
jgi:hypothetical protein